MKKKVTLVNYRTGLTTLAFETLLLVNSADYANRKSLGPARRRVVNDLVDCGYLDYNTDNIVCVTRAGGAALLKAHQDRDAILAKACRDGGPIPASEGEKWPFRCACRTATP